MMRLERCKIEIKCSKFTKNIFDDIQEKIQDAYNDTCLNKNIVILEKESNRTNIEFYLDDGIKKRIERFKRNKKEDN